MPDTERSKAALLATHFPDNSSGAIKAQDLRDFVASALGGYASIYAASAAGAQLLGTTPAKLTGFAANGPSSGATPDHANDQITIGVTAVYWVSFAASVSGDAATYTVKLYKGANPEGSLLDSCKPAAGTDVEKLCFAGPVSLSAGDVLTVYGEADSSAKNLTIRSATLAVRRIG